MICLFVSFPLASLSHCRWAFFFLKFIDAGRLLCLCMWLAYLVIEVKHLLDSRSIRLFSRYVCALYTHLDISRAFLYNLCYGNCVY